MRILKHRFNIPSRSTTVNIIPLGDIHIGAAACDEARLQNVINRIKDDPNCYWYGMGDYCLPLDAEILTIDGFRKFNELNEGDLVLGFDGKENVWTHLKSVYLTSNVIFSRLHSKSFDIDCTSNHGWIVQDCHPHRWLGIRKKRSSYIKKVSTFNLQAGTKIIVSAPCNINGNLDISDDEAALLGWVICDGGITIRNEHSFIAYIEQAKEPYRSQIRERFGDWFTAEYVRKVDNYLPMSTFNIKVKRFRELLQKLDCSPKNLESALPSLVAKFSVTARKSMLEAMIQAEGWKDGDRWWFSQLPGFVLDTFQILATLAGIRLSIGKLNANGVRCIRLLDHKKFVTVADLKVDKYSWVGDAWCPQTELGNFVTRYKNQITITGNCDFINMRDPRANTGTLASWIGVKDLSDLVAAQKDRFLDFIQPIASKCLGLVEGNHETSIHRFYERDIYSEIVTAIKQWKKLPADQPLAVGYYGWSLLYFQRGAQTNMVKVNLHHGYVGGKLAGAKALEMQRWLWSHDADIVIFGHSHNTNIQIEQSEGINDAGDLVLKNRYGVYAGSFLKTVNENGASTYSEVKGYLPMPTAGVQIMIRPGAFDSADSTRSEPISVMTGVV